MWYAYILGAVGAKMVYGRVKRAWIQYTSLRDLKTYGESIGCPYVPGEDQDAYRKRLIDLRNKNIGQK